MAVLGDVVDLVNGMSKTCPATEANDLYRTGQTRCAIKTTARFVADHHASKSAKCFDVCPQVLVFE